MAEVGVSTIRAAFLEQAALCRAVGSPFTADILTTLAGCLSDATRTGKEVLNWSGPPLIDALPLRLTGGLHALARSGRDAAWSALYHDRSADLAANLSRVMSDWDMWLLPWLGSAPQTNEVGRSAVLWPGIMEVARRFGPKVELLELGASAGLNLNMDRYGYDLGGVSAGLGSSPLQMRPVWTGPIPKLAPVEVVRRSGVDLNPLDPAQAVVAERLLAYVWPDQPERLARIAAAIDIAKAHPPLVERGDGADWIEAQLAEPQDAGVTRLVFHSIALQYFPPDRRMRVIDALAAAGKRATPQRPLAWLNMEFASQVTDRPLLRLRCWPGSGASETLAKVHPHGARIDWVGPD